MDNLKEVYVFSLKDLTFELFGYLNGNSINSDGINFGEIKYSYQEIMDKLKLDNKELYQLSIGNLQMKMGCLFVKN